MVRKAMHAMIFALLAWGATANAAVDKTADVTRATLDNGLRVVIVHDSLAPVVTTQMNYLAGSNEVPEGFPGTAHAVEHMMFRGSPGLSKDQLAAVSANLGGAFNAQTTEGVTQYYFVAPAENLDVALRIHAIRMRGADMTQASWDKERGAIEQEVSRDMSSPNFKMYSQIREALFKGTPYGHTPLGTRPSFDKTTAKMLKDFRDTWYAPNNAILVIVGKVDPGKTLAEVKSLFGDIPRRQLPSRPSFQFRAAQPKTIKLPTDTPYGVVQIAYRMPGSRDKDYAASIVLGDALASQRADLYGMSVSGTALYGTFSTNYLPHAGIGLAVGVFPRDGSPDRVLSRMRDILEQTASHGVAPALVEAAKRKAIASLEFQKNSVSGLASAWSRALAWQELGSPSDIKRQIAAVTPAQVDALAHRIFTAPAITGILTPESSGEASASKGFGGAESFASNPDKPVVMPDWAQKAFTNLHVPASSMDPKSYTLANGLRLIVQPESISDTVQVYGRVKINEDMQAPEGREGVQDLLNSMFRFGTRNLDRLQYQQALDAISAEASAGSSFSLAVPSAHFEQGMKLLADNELNPAFPDRDFRVAKVQLMQLLSGQLKSPDFLLNLGLANTLYPAKDPAQRFATPRSVSHLTKSRMQHYYYETFRPDMTTIVVVGNVDPEKARSIVEQTFGSWESHGSKPDVDYPAVPANKPAQFVVPDKTSVQDSVQMVQTVGVTQNDPQRYALELGNQVLGGGFYASRLYRDLRDRSGLVYTVGSNFSLDKKRGTYSVSFGSDPDKVARARAMIVRDLQQMQSEPVSTDDLVRAKGILLRQFPLGESSFAAIGGQLLNLSLQGKPLDAATIAAQHYYKLTAEEVQQAFRRHIRPNGFVTAVKGPSPK